MFLAVVALVCGFGEAAAQRVSDSKVTLQPSVQSVGSLGNSFGGTAPSAVTGSGTLTRDAVIGVALGAAAGAVVGFVACNPMCGDDTRGETALMLAVPGAVIGGLIGLLVGVLRRD
ncbi:MAG: hypothetical protein ACYC1S_16150 [Gemmatimonadaceae bacterium]